MSVWLPLLLACLSEPPYGAALVDTAALDAEETVGGIEPEWTATEALSHLQGALDAGLPQPWVARETFLGLIAEGQDETCPGTTDFDGSKPLGCVSEAGYLYAGISQYREDEMGWSLGGDFDIQEPDGNTFDAAGYVYVHGNQHGRVTEFTGYWAHEGGLDWMDPGRSGMFNGAAAPDRAELDGGLDLGSTYVHFADVVMELQPQVRLSGTLGIRDEAGAWWWLELDDEGCGPLSFAEVERDTGCVELEGPIGAWAEGLEL